MQQQLSTASEIISGADFLYSRRFHIAATRLISLHQNKGQTIIKSISDRINYAENPDKTQDHEYISAYQCDPRTAATEFMLSKSIYEQRTGREAGKVIAYQIRQSFKPGEITPEEANQVGYELAMRFTKGQHAFIVCTHTDRAHIHNHIIFNSTSLDCQRKFRNFYLAAYAVRRISDHICLEHGLSVIEPRPYAERQHGPHYSGKTNSRRQNRTASNGLSRRNKTRGDFSMLIDIQEKLRQGKGIGYARWAKRFNLKQMAQVLIYLQENNINDYDELVRRTDDASAHYDQLAASIKDAETRLSEIAELKKHIFNYSRTKDVYTAYRKAGFSKQFYEEHRDELTLHKAAKDAFDRLNGKVPSIKELNEEYASVLDQKKRDYAEYRDTRADMRQLLLARKNVETLLELDEIDHEKSNEMKRENQQKR